MLSQEIRQDHGLLRGQTYEEIAAELGYTSGTVRMQAAKVYEKLGVSSRGQAVRKALHLGILHMPTDGA